MPEYIVVPAVDAERVREALGRVAAEAQGKPYPIPGPTPESQPERYYADPQRSADGTKVAFGPRDPWLDAALGKSVTTDGGAVSVPAKYESLTLDWFAPPPGSLLPMQAIAAAAAAARAGAAADAPPTETSATGVPLAGTGDRRQPAPPSNPPLPASGPGKRSTT